LCEAYYRCLLEVDAKTPPNLLPEQYTELLRGKPEQPAIMDDDDFPQIEPGPVPPNGPPIDDGGMGDLFDDDPVVVHTSIPSRKPAAPRRPPVVPHPDPDGLGLPPGFGDPDDDDHGPAPVVHAPYAKAEFLHGDTIEGVKIMSQVSNTAGGYSRWVVWCPLCHSDHLQPGERECQRSRGTTGRMVARLGITEVYSFLGCWIKNASKYKTRKGHMDYNPTLVEMREYAKAKGWIG